MEVKRKCLQPVITAVLLQLNASEGERLLSPTEIKSGAEDATNFIDGSYSFDACRSCLMCWHYAQQGEEDDRCKTMRKKLGSAEQAPQPNDLILRKELCY